MNLGKINYDKYKNMQKLFLLLVCFFSVVYFIPHCYETHKKKCVEDCACRWCLDKKKCVYEADIEHGHTCHNYTARTDQCKKENGKTKIIAIVIFSLFCGIANIGDNLNFLWIIM